MSVLVQRYFRDKQAATTDGIEAELEALRGDLAAYKHITTKKINEKFIDDDE
jgi:hypothetical protein